MNDPDTPPYSEATVALVVEALRGDGVVRSWGHDARRVLDALAAAGLLLPEGAETQWGLRRDDRESVAPYASRENAEYWQMFAVEEWELVSRPVGPWSPVPPEPKVPTDAT